jgi:archaeosortase A (PGF-CTERM-specific)
MPGHLGGAIPGVPVVTDPFAWIVIASFVIATLVHKRSPFGKDLPVLKPRHAATGAWLLFAIFWLLLVPHFAFVQKSYIEGFLSAAAVPASLYTAYLVGTEKRDLSTLTQSIALMGLIYVPFLTVAPLQEWLIEATTNNAEWLLTVLGYSPAIVAGDLGYQNTFRFVLPNSHRIEVSVILACTGIGSMSVVSGLITSTNASLSRKLHAAAIAIPVIYLANILRVAFIAVAFGKQWFQVYVQEILFLFGASDPYLVSYFVSDRIISQSLSVVVLVGLVWALLRVVPELFEVVEDVAYIATGNEYQIRQAFD